MGQLGAEPIPDKRWNRARPNFENDASEDEKYSISGTRLLAGALFVPQADAGRRSRHGPAQRGILIPDLIFWIRP